jgi:DNA-binding transcriptional regulator YiaG
VDVAEVIKTIRIGLNLTQDELVKQLGVAFTTVNRWENRRIRPNSMARTVLKVYCKENGVDQELIGAIDK